MTHATDPRAAMERRAIDGDFAAREQDRPKPGEAAMEERVRALVDRLFPVLEELADGPS